MPRPALVLVSLLRLAIRTHPLAVRIPRRPLSFRTQPTSRPTENLNVSRLAREREDYDRNKRVFLMSGAIAGIISFIYTAWKLKKAIVANDEGKTELRLDSGSPTDLFVTEAGTKRKVVVHDAEGREIVPTGNKTVPDFPRIIEITTPTAQASSAATLHTAGVEYTLVGLGIRTVSFLGIQVYVVGYYVATSDIATLQSYLIKKINPIATTLVPGERETLREALLDPVKGEETWNTILRESGCRSAFRIVTVRDTDFHHLRSGFLRAIAARTQKNTDAYADERFGAAVREFKGLFNQGSVAKQKELIIQRDERGRLNMIYDDGKKDGRKLLGSVEDERVSRLVWLNYLAGKSVASDAARKNIVEGIMEFVARPVGTVAAQVV